MIFCSPMLKPTCTFPYMHIGFDWQSVLEMFEEIDNNND